MKKIFVLDTSVLLEDPNAIFAFDDNKVVIPSIVLEEIDSKKRMADDLGRNARHISRTIDKIRQSTEISLSHYIPLENGGEFKVALIHKHEDAIKDYFKENTNDNKIISVALSMHQDHQAEYDEIIKKRIAEGINLADEEEEKEYIYKNYVFENEKVILLSKDVLMRVKANTLEIEAGDYVTEKIMRGGEKYEGFMEVEVPVEVIDELYRNHEISIDEEPFTNMELHPNEFLILKDSDGLNKSALVKFEYIQNKIRLLIFGDYDVWGIRAKNAQQKMAFDVLLDDNIPLVTISGRAGTGKTLLALACGLLKTEEMGIYTKLLVARPIIPMGKDIGFLPGDKDEKMRPWMQPVYDNLEYIFSNRKGDIEGIVAGMKSIEVEALTFIRGRTIPQQFIIIDEAQNLTKHEAKTIVSRVGEGSKIVLVGDPEQIDHPYLDSTNNGLSYIIERFKDQKEAAHITFKKGERSILAKLAADLL